VSSSLLTRILVTAVTAAASVALLVTAGAPAMASNAGALASVVNAFDPTKATGTNFNPVQVTAPAACNRAATRHVTKIIAVTPAHRADRAAAKAWVGDNLYATASVGLPGPLTVQASNSWQGLADGFGQKLVAGRYDLELRCQDNLGTKIYQEWYGHVIFTSPTAWKGYSAKTTSAGTSSARPTGAAGATPSSPAGTPTPGDSASATSSPSAAAASPLPSGSAAQASAAKRNDGPSGGSVKGIFLIVIVVVAAAAGVGAILRARRRGAIGQNGQ
jgi:hypothetical protein